MASCNSPTAASWRGAIWPPGLLRGNSDTDWVMRDRRHVRMLDDRPVTEIRDDHVKVHFRMDIDEKGWPPASVESLWAVDLGDGTARLDNSPWFVRGIASGDIVTVEPDDEGVIWAGQTVQPSQNCTIRLIVLKRRWLGCRSGERIEGIPPPRHDRRRHRALPDGGLGCTAGGGPAEDPQAVGTRCCPGLVALGGRVCHRSLESHCSRVMAVCCGVASRNLLRSLC
ncbi:protein of unknown function (DUF4265) [Nocardia amikacinitolerans]|nr:protein of unknown function (DUF4265) [Nocardia amikacinitolerans]